MANAFTSCPFDDTELFHYPARWYDPKAGRFISEDPIGFAGGDANLARYVGNDPGNGADPTGLAGPVSQWGATDPFAPDAPGGLDVPLSVLLDPAPNAIEEYRREQPAQVSFDKIQAYRAAGVQSPGTFLLIHDLPLLSGISKLYEAYYGQSLDAFDFGQKLSPSERVFRSAAGAIDVTLSLTLLRAGYKACYKQFAGRAARAVKAPVREAAGASARSPVGRAGAPLKNAPYQPVRNAPGSVGGRQYSGHAFDQMQNRGMTPSVVENTIQNGRAIPGKYPGTTVHYDAVNNVSVVTDTGSGRVVTVSPGQFTGGAQ